MNQKRKVVAVVISAVAITGSASALAHASTAKVRSASKTTKTTVTTVTRTFNVNGMTGMAGMPGDAMGKMGRGGDAAVVLADLVTKGTITAAESKAVSDAWSALELAKHSVKPTTPPAPGTMRTPGTIDPELAQALKDLVAKGTLTDAKAKAITDAVTAAEAAEAANRPAFGGPMGGPMGGFMNPGKDAIITTTLGIDATTLHNRLAAGESLATIAGAKKDALIAALVADETKQIDAAVTAGKLTAAQATTLKANLTAHVTAEVNEAGHAGPMGDMGGKMGGRGHGHDGMGMPGTKNGIPQTTTSGSKN